MAQSHPSERKKIQTQICLAIAFGTTVFILGYFVIPIPVPELPTLIDRVAYTLQWQIASVLTLFVGIGTVARKRLQTTAIDPINGRGEHHVLVDCRYVQNTLEQLVMNSFGQMMLSTYLKEDQMKAIPLLVLLFVIGRITFWIGYRRSYLHRAFGFALTVSSNAFMYIVLCFYFVETGPLRFLSGN